MHRHVDRALRELSLKQPVEMRVTGRSMGPALADGARVAVRWRRLYLPGDVVVVRSRDGRRRVHRVIGYRPTAAGIRLITQGDEAPAADASTPIGDVVGRVVGGQCPGELIRVPLRHRARALLRFGRLLLLRASGR